MTDDPVSGLLDPDFRRERAKVLELQHSEALTMGLLRKIVENADYSVRGCCDPRKPDCYPDSLEFSETPFFFITEEEAALLSALLKEVGR